MKEKIHPKYYPKAKVSCACGNTFMVGSTLEKIKVEICSKCHPFYTGEEKIIDTAGRVEKFKARRARAHQKQEGTPRTKAKPTTGRAKAQKRKSTTTKKQ